MLTKWCRWTPSRNRSKSVCARHFEGVEIKRMQSDNFFRPRILVVEDQEAIQALVTAMVKIRSLECEAASSLAEARERMKREHYDLLFIDVNLPDGSGLSLVE